MKKRRRFQEGGDIPDIDREPLRDSQGNIVRSGIDTFTERFNINRGISPSDKGEPVMSGSTRDRGYEEAVALGKRMREERDAAAMDEAMLRKPSQQKTTVAPVKPSTITSTSVAADLEEPGTAGFSRTPLKTAAPKVEAKPKAEVKSQPKAEVKPPPKVDVKAEIERLKAYDKPLEGVYPEAALIGGPGLKALRTMLSGAGSKAATQAAKPRVEPKITQEAAKATTKKPGADYYYGSNSPKMAEKPGAMTTKPSQGGELATKGELVTKGSDLVKRREAMAQLESPRRRLPFEKDMGKARLETQANKRRQLGGSSRSSDVIEMGMKRGGKVGSASSRGDGIAKRGKTRGRYI
jgi:hypothetical protein